MHMYAPCTSVSPRSDSASRVGESNLQHVLRAHMLLVQVTFVDCLCSETMVKIAAVNLGVADVLGDDQAKYDEWKAAHGSNGGEPLALGPAQESRSRSRSDRRRREFEQNQNALRAQEAEEARRWWRPDEPPSVEAPEEPPMPCQAPEEPPTVEPPSRMGRRRWRWQRRWRPWRTSRPRSCRPWSRRPWRTSSRRRRGWRHLLQAQHCA